MCTCVSVELCSISSVFLCLSHFSSLPLKHPVFQHMLGVTLRLHLKPPAWTSNLKYFIDFLPAHPGDLSKQSSYFPSYQNDAQKAFHLVFFCGRLEVWHLKPQLLSSPMMKYWHLLISVPLLRVTHRLFLWPNFWAAPISLRKRSADARWPSDLCLAATDNDTDLSLFLCRTEGASTVLLSVLNVTLHSFVHYILVLRGHL